MKQDFTQLAPELRSGFFIPQQGKVPVGNWRDFLKPFDQAIKDRKPWEHLGRWVNPEDGFIFIDLDGVRNPETGVVEKWAEEILVELSSYTEISLSGKGFKVVVRGKLPADWKKDHPNPERPGHTICEPVEIYSGHSNKLMTLTGNRAQEYMLYGVESRQEEAAKLLTDCRAGKYAPDFAKRKSPQHWREVFRMGADLDPEPGKIFIDGILGEGITAFGAYSGVGKTWVGLSLAHALLMGNQKQTEYHIGDNKLFGYFKPLEKPCNVLYLVPEESERNFRARMQKMRIPMDGGFFCQTMRDGAIGLGSPLLLQCIEEIKPVVFLDTAIRFSQGEENSGSDQAHDLAEKIMTLCRAGAKALVLMHHRAKGSQDKEPTLENALRGSGEFAAMCDCVWVVEPADKIASHNPDFKLRLTCVKPRHIVPADPFVIQGTPYVDDPTIGDFRVVDFAHENAPENGDKDKDELVEKFIRENPEATVREIRKQCHVAQRVVDRVKKKLK